MTGFKRSRRIGALLAGAAIVVTVAGCTAGTTTIPAGQSAQMIACTAGPTPGDFWVPGPGATHLRIHVTKSDSTKPLGAGVLRFDSSDGYFGIVWDGTKSTGPQEIVVWGGQSELLFLGVENGPTSQPINASWTLTALDYTGKDVGLTCEG
jgi:hypothetical protein